MNRLLISLAVTGALLLGNASYAVTNTAPAPVAKPVASAATAPVKSASANAVTPVENLPPNPCANKAYTTRACDPPATGRMKATCHDAKGKSIKCPTAARK